MIKSVAHALRGKVVVGEARGANDNLAREFGLGNAFPILVAVCAGQEKLANEGRPCPDQFTTLTYLQPEFQPQPLP